MGYLQHFIEESRSHFSLISICAIFQRGREPFGLLHLIVLCCHVSSIQARKVRYFPKGTNLVTYKGHHFLSQRKQEHLSLSEINTHLRFSFHIVYHLTNLFVLWSLGCKQCCCPPLNRDCIVTLKWKRNDHYRKTLNNSQWSL